MFPVIFLLAPPSFLSYCALEDGIVRPLGDVTCRDHLSFSYSHCRHDVLVLTDVPRDYLSYFFVADMVCVWDVQDISVIYHLHGLHSPL